MSDAPEQTVTMTRVEFREHIDGAVRQGIEIGLREVRGYCDDLLRRYPEVIDRAAPNDPRDETGEG